MTAVAFKPKTMALASAALQRVLPVRLAAIHTQADHERAVEFMNQLLDGVSDDEEHELAELAAELGSQSVVSEILNRRRQINARRAKALAQRFDVLAAVFI